MTGAKISGYQCTECEPLRLAEKAACHRCPLRLRRIAGGPPRSLYTARRIVLYRLPCRLRKLLTSPAYSLNRHGRQKCAQNRVHRFGILEDTRHVRIQ